MKNPVRIIYTDSLDQSAEYLRMTLPLMHRYSVPSHPHNFTVWYEYAVGNNEVLKQAIDEIIAGGKPFTEDINQDLYLRFFVQDEVSLEKMRQSLRGILMELRQDVSLASGNLSHYRETLEKFARILDGNAADDSVGTETSRVLLETHSTEQSQHLLDTRLSSAAKEMESLRRELDQIREESLTDALTGIGNRKAFDAALAQALNLSAVHNISFSVLMADIDHFKGFNDRFGHLIGDRVLRFVAHTLRRCVKGQDKAYRFGGEEFAVILPNTPVNGAFSVAEQIRRETAAGELKDKDSGASFGRITISLGVTQAQRGESGEQLIRRVDRALYLAKRRGRDRTEKAN